ncbi:hypothetical protein D3C87_1682420 [compost metagenome]
MLAEVFLLVILLLVPERGIECTTTIVFMPPDRRKHVAECIKCLAGRFLNRRMIIHREYIQVHAELFDKVELIRLPLPDISQMRQRGIFGVKNLHRKTLPRLMPEECATQQVFEPTPFTLRTGSRMQPHEVAACLNVAH